MRAPTASFGRVSASDRPSSRIPALDGIRGLAILGVVAMHLLLIAGSPWGASTGARGTITWALLGNVIDIFFVVSGFLIFIPMVRRGGLGGLGDYAVARLARIVPGYWFCLAVLFVLTTWFPTSPFIVSPSLGDVAIHMSALQMPARMLDPSLSMGFGIDGALWMISIIVGFYLVLPLLARPYLRHPVAGLVIAAAITLLWKEAILHLGGLFEALSNGSSPASDIPLIAVDQLPGWAFSFALGMTAAWAYESFPSERMRAVGLSRWFVAAAVAAYVLSSWRYGDLAAASPDASAGSSSRLHPLVSLVSSCSRAALIAIVVLGPLWLRRPFESRGPRKLSELSFGLYLIHLPVAIYVGYLLDPSRDGSALAVLVWFATVVPISLAYSQLSLSLVERPVLRRVRRRQARDAAASPTGAIPAGP